MGELALLPDAAPTAGRALAIGRAGELRVASELLLRDFMPLMAMVDTGVDIVLENGPTLQVKTSAKPREQKGGAASYHFRFSTFSRGQGTRQRMHADFAVCWCIEDNAFFIVPKVVIGARASVHIPIAPSRPSMFNPYREAWELLA